MIEVKVFYNIRPCGEGAIVKFFSNKECLQIDKKIFESLGEGIITMEFIDGATYIDAVLTNGDYKKELEELEDSLTDGQKVIYLKEIRNLD